MVVAYHNLSALYFSQNQNSKSINTATKSVDILKQKLDEDPIDKTNQYMYLAAKNLAGIEDDQTTLDNLIKFIQQNTMKSHDLAHIVFGCSTKLVGEMSVELWTLFANDLGFKKYMEIAQNSEINKQPFEILNKIGYLKVLWVFTINFWRIPYIWFLSTEMTKKWSFLNEEQYMQKTVGEIRKEFNIKLI